MHMCYSFDFLSAAQPTVERVRAIVDEFEQSAPDGWSCWAFSNHDVVRHASRWADQVSDREGFLKMAATLILSLRGSVCLYQGEELGLTEALLDLDDLQDPYGIRFWPKFKGRDGCRTPMVWSGNERYGGFTDGKPWLPVPYEHLTSSVDLQAGRPGSILEHYRDMLTFRAQHPVLAKGDITFHDASQDVLLFTRSYNEQQVLVAINLSESDAVIEIDDASWETLSGGPQSHAERDGSRLKLGPHASYFAGRVV